MEEMTQKQITLLIPKSREEQIDKLISGLKEFVLNEYYENPKVINIMDFRFKKSVSQRIAPSDILETTAKAKGNEANFIIINDYLNKI